MKAVAIIPARAGSKGLPGKNVRSLDGQPLIAWSVRAALASRYIDRVVVSSNDRQAIEAAMAAGADVPFVRPDELAADDTASEPVILHALDQLALDQPECQYDVVVLLQPTSPLRRTEDIDGCLERLEATGAPAVLSVTLSPKSPFWMLNMDEAGRLSRMFETTATRRQDLPPAWLPNGAVYAARIDWFRHNGGFLGPGTLGYAMPAERSIDIDTALDFAMAEYLMRHGEAGDPG